ncbi:hypothetical protein PSENEW3_00000224 [Picochlorum sp. SENEW3]|nr:hypothetical protein PSENEW3_00000224 [Picochlorum sp. SENEW3]
MGSIQEKEHDDGSRRLVALEQQAEEVASKMEQLSARAAALQGDKEMSQKDLGRVRDELAKAKRDCQEMSEHVSKVQGELASVCQELRGCHAREKHYLGENRDMRRKNKELEDEVARLDGVALGLEHELSAAELRLEAYEDTEPVGAVKEQLNAALSDLQSKEWRIEDLVEQVACLKEYAAEYHGRALDAEKENASLVHRLEEAESRYHSAINSSVASLQHMDTRLSALKNVVSKEGSNNTVSPQWSIGQSVVEHGEHKLRIEAQRQDMEDLEMRLHDMEEDYLAAKMMCEDLRAENATLREHQSGMSDRFVEQRLNRMKEESQRELQMALERVEDEYTEKLGKAVASALHAQKEEHEREVQGISTERNMLQESLKKIKITAEESNRKEQQALKALKAAEARLESSRVENRQLQNEKEALCNVIEELKYALSAAEGRIMNKKTNTALNKENAGVPFSRATEKFSPSLRGESKTPLRSLVNIAD